MEDGTETGVDGGVVDDVDGPTEGGAVPGDAVGAPDPHVRHKGGRHLPSAITVGVGLAVLFVGSVLVDARLFSAVVVLAMLIAVWEAGTELATTGLSVARPVLLVAAVVTGVATHALGVPGQALGLLVLVLGAFGWELASAPRDDVVGKLGTTLLVGVWVVLLGSYAILIIIRDQGAVAAILAVGGGAIVADVGAYAVGRLVGRHKIAPTVSPNKTWEGLVGGVVTSAALAAWILPVVDGELFADPVDAAIIAGVAALAGFFGDLAESMVKRDVGLKDLGSLLPGHGGMLDRIDGLLFGLPVGYYALELVT